MANSLQEIEYYMYVNKYPANAPPKITNAVFIFLKMNVTMKPAMAIVAVFQFVIEILPNSTQTTRIRATDATFTVSGKAAMVGGCRNFLMSGFNKATKRNEGRNIPIVAAIASIINTAKTPGIMDK